MIININIDTQDTLSDNDKVVLLALAGEIRLGESAVSVTGTEPTPVVDWEATLPEGAPGEEPLPAPEDVNEPAPPAEPGPLGEEPKAKKPVNVSDASLKKYDFRRDEDGDIVCNHCDYVSETGRALHLHAGTHQDDKVPAEKTPLKAVKDEPEAGVDAFMSTEPDKQDVADAEKAAAGDPDPEPVAEVPEPVEAKVVDPKVLRDEVAKVATEMVAAQKQADIRGVLDELGVARVSMIAEKDLQTFLDAEPIAAFIAAKAG